MSSKKFHTGCDNALFPNFLFNSLSAELGHTLNLAHSGTVQGPYFDKHGMMGYSYDEFNSPKMCFNAPKSWQLGWFADQSISWNPNDGTWVGTMVGDVDYGENPAHTIILRLETGYNTEIYVKFNRAKGYNSQTKMSADMVTIVEQGRGYSQSTYIDGMYPGQSHTISRFGTSGKDLVIEYISQGESSDEAIVAAYYDDCRFPSCCQGPFCPVPQTDPPTPSPTSTPTSHPTLAPTPSPTMVPTIVPTFVPTDGAMTVPLTLQPTLDPTPEPTQQPTGTTINLIGTGTPQLLLSEEFENDVGMFASSGEKVKFEKDEDIGVAKFQLKKGADNAPRISTVVDLQGQTIITIFFWFKAMFLDVDQSIAVQYSIDNGETWTIVREIQVGGSQYSFGEWYKVTDILFNVPDGTSDMVVQILGRTGDELPENATITERSDNSEFVVARFVCLGDSPVNT
jgi:hypothetical protein